MLAIVPKLAREQVVSWIKQGLNDLSISRPSSRVPWGITTPSDSDQKVSLKCLKLSHLTFVKVYVWFDALCNYLTVAKHSSDQLSTANAVHLVGKDILRYPEYSCDDIIAFCSDSMQFTGQHF